MGKVSRKIISGVGIVNGLVGIVLSAIDFYQGTHGTITYVIAGLSLAILGASYALLKNK